MARIKNETVYPRDTSITGQEIVIGSDTGGGATKNYTVDDLATYIQTDQTNIVRLFYTKKATTSGIDAAVIAVNASNEFTVANQDIACVVVQRNETTITNTKTDEKIWYDYYWVKDVGQGTYGVGGTIVITADNLEFRKSTEIYTIQTNDNLPPVVYELTTEDISTPPEEVVNITTVVGGYLIDSNADYFFEIREVEYNTKGVPIFTGNIKYYRFVGADGTYGNGFTATVNGDFILLSSNDLGITEGTYLSLTDTIDTTYEGKDDWVPTVYRDPMGSITPVLKLKPVVTLPDLFRPNAAVEYGVTHISGLTYYVYVNKFIIDGIDYNIFASDTITLSNGDVANNRIDVIVARINPLGSINPTIEVLEGTPAGSPVEESINLLTEVKLSVKLVLANETTDPNVTSDMVYNENTEWTNSSLAAGADLDDTTSPPYIGSKSLNVPAIGGTGDSVIWDKGSSATFDVDDRLIFALKETGTTEKNTSITIKLIDISSGGYWLRTYYINKLKSRGFDEPRGSTWNLVNMPFTDFVPTTISMTTYDRIEFSIKNSSELDFDWIHVQGGIDHEDPTTDISFIGLIDTPTNYEGGASKVVTVKSDESGVEFTPIIQLVADCSTVITLNNTFGRLCNMWSANATTTYTTTGTTGGAWQKTLINAGSEPTVTGATKIFGSDFIISTDMYLVCTHNGSKVEFWFEQIAL